MHTTMKQCIQCGKMFASATMDVKGIHHYVAQKYCSKECRKRYHAAKYALSHKDGINTTRKKRYQDNKEVITKKRKAYTETHKEELKTWRLNNIDRIRKNKRAYNKKRGVEDPSYKLNKAISNSVYRAIRGIKKSKHSIELLGCSVEALKQHLEAQFSPGMSWDNWGVFGWHIDHKRPIASFDLTDPQQQHACFHYTNLQPLWWMDNITKGDKYEQIHIDT